MFNGSESKRDCTVSRVMEKCSFCIQRIRWANIKANIEEDAIKDGDVVTACQQACPTGAIVFGDMNDHQPGVPVP